MRLSKSTPVVISIAIPLMALFSCKKLPETDFTYAPVDNPEAGEFIQFENLTPEASSFEWEFGDGTTSGQEDPVQKYDEAGNYDVTLTAYNDAGGQPKIKTVTINDPTVLGFMIMDSTQSNVIVGSEVWLYDNQTDWDNFDEPMLSAITDDDGVVSFSNLEAIVYYIWAVKEETGGAWISGGYTPAITLNEYNAFIVPCVWLADEGTKAGRQSPEPVRLIRR